MNNHNNNNDDDDDNELFDTYNLHIIHNYAN